MTFPGRYSARIEGDFVVFVIGARINRWWKVPSMLLVLRSMGKMQKELIDNPALGCMHIENWFGRTTLSLQYWRSFECLEAFARDPEATHLPAWRKFNRQIKDSGDMGIYHETFKVRSGEFEAVYGNMPLFGLAHAGEQVKLGKESTAAIRAGQRAKDEPPVQAY